MEKSNFTQSHNDDILFKREAHYAKVDRNTRDFLHTGGITMDRDEFYYIMSGVHPKNLDPEGSAFMSSLFIDPTIEERLANHEPFVMNNTKNRKSWYVCPSEMVQEGRVVHYAAATTARGRLYGYAFLPVIRFAIGLDDTEKLVYDEIRPATLAVSFACRRERYIPWLQPFRCNSPETSFPSYITEQSLGVVGVAATLLRHRGGIVCADNSLDQELVGKLIPHSREHAKMSDKFYPDINWYAEIRRRLHEEIAEEEAS